MGHRDRDRDTKEERRDRDIGRMTRERKGTRDGNNCGQREVRGVREREVGRTDGEPCHHDGDDDGEDIDNKSTASGDEINEAEFVDEIEVIALGEQYRW